MSRVLEEGGATPADLVKLNTYYQFTGEGRAVAEFQEAMTKVRMEHIADPGPSATAVRVVGFAFEDLLIEIEGIAAIKS